MNRTKVLVPEDEANAKSRVNWGRGFSRLSLSLLAVVEAVFLTFVVDSRGKEQDRWLMAAFIVCIVWLVVHRVVAWIANGFRD